MAGLMGSLQGRCRAGESKRQPGGRFPPCLLERPPAASQLFSFLSPPFLSFLLPVLPFVLPALLNLQVLGGLFGRGSHEARRWVSGSCPLLAWLTPKQTMLITVVLAGLWEGFVAVPAEVTLAWEGKQGPWARNGRGCEWASLSLCLGRGWLCPGIVWPGGAEGFPQLSSTLPGLAGNTSPCPGSDQLILTESSWHCCYNSRTHFSVSSRPIPSCCPKITPRDQLK